ncbi:MAG: beta-galactosidase [Thermobacillus sp. ZCTH02-B1]|uniref:beta-galactosidase n=1 Tax=Thermobacillus sp. ZCTH02-B1 TaxID=1858795 RepID=UPI000B56CBCC|nr:beta-galactosidase [Thermobacillus sp. ZCTH02-B1]OUM94445.1 MAG: beta-galactosidase [Thermobacillus sp. ZCTH02-B1]
MYLGVDYYPDYWPEQLMDEDLDGIVGLGANIVRIGEFAWHRMEPREGQYDFSFFDRVLEKVKSRGLKVMFGVPTATFPAWLAAKHPSILSRDETGAVRAFGGRRQYCYNSPEYREYALRLTRRLVEHYRDEPAIVAWQVDNEFGHEGSDMCWCPNCHAAFQRFLEEKYGSIDRLNETYGTIFWGQTYNDFSEIPMPLPTITTHNPSLRLDWARFRSRSLNGFAEALVRTVRECKGDHQSVTTNLAGGFFHKWFDHAEHARLYDFISYDHYPVWGGLREPLSPGELGMNLDFVRGLTGKPFWIAEQLIGAQGHDLIGYLPRPNQARMWSFQAFARGCSNMLYFVWRAMDRGAEQFCTGIVDQDNARGRKYEEVRSVFRDIAPHAELVESDIEAETAVLYDHDNIWSWRFQPQSEAFDFTREMLRLYDPFHRLNCLTDVIPADRDFARYKVLLVPVMQIMERTLADRIRAFAEAGGTVVFSFRTGIKDKANNLHFGMPQPGHVADLCGIRIRAYEALPKGERVRLAAAPDAGGEDLPREAHAEVWRDLIEPVSAETLYRYDDPFFPHAAVTRRRLEGGGTVYYVGCGLDDRAMRAIARIIVRERKICYIDSDPGVEVVERRVRGRRYRFVMNHNGREASFQGRRLNPYDSFIVPVDEA